MPWDPACYHRFQAQRAAPFEDLVRLIQVRPGLRVVDLGCGTGELTRRLAEHLPDSHVLGVDSSPTMLEKAPSAPGLEFRLGDLERVEGSFDLVFSHAAVQWIPDHDRLIPALMRLVKPGGQLAVQMPSNHDHPGHQLILEIAEPLGLQLRRSPVLRLRRYAELLFESGAEEQVAFEKVYPHVMEDSDMIAEWTRGTALVPYLEQLEDPSAFLERYRQRLRETFPQRPVFYGFTRILLWARVARESLARNHPRGAPL